MMIYVEYNNIYCTYKVYWLINFLVIFTENECAFVNWFITLNILKKVLGGTI